MWTTGATVQARAEQENRATGTETKTACSAVLPRNYNHRPESGNGFGKRWRMPVRERSREQFMKMMKNYTTQNENYGEVFGAPQSLYSLFHLGCESRF